MAFQKAALLSAVLTSASLVRAAPLPSSSSSGASNSSCTLHPKAWGPITMQGFPLSVSDSGTIVVGGNPQNFAYAICSQTNSGYKGLTQQYTGYIVNAYDNTQCLTASNLDQDGATFSLQDCRFNGAGDVWSSQSFAWNFENDGSENTATAYFNGENFNAVNSTSPPIYTLRSQYAKPNFDGQLGELIADYTPDLKALPAGQLALSLADLPVLPPPMPAGLTCSAHNQGQLVFSNTTYNGPLNAKWEADANSQDTFVFEECDYSASGYAPSGDYVYGRIRPGTDESSGEYNCYYLEGPGSTSAKEDVWINGLQTKNCSYTAEVDVDVVKYNKADNSFVFLPKEAYQGGEFYFYTQADYTSEYGVTQYVWDPKGVGAVFLYSDNANLTRYPPGKVTFKPNP